MLIYADASRPAGEIPGRFVSEPAPQIVTYGEIDRALEQMEREDVDQPQVEEMDIPPDPDGESLDALMTAGPSLLDEIAALTAMPRPAPSVPPRSPAYARPRPPSRGAQRFNNRDWGRTAMWGPGSMTRAVGAGGDLVGNAQGDGRGNVTRDNFAHFGAVGTRSR